jgi:uncharacterized damage-inducible protein DinB
MALHRWFERQFAFDLPLWMAPNIVERLRGTAARAEDRLRGLDPSLGVRRNGTKWSIHQHMGHLGDTEPLWLTRVEDLRTGRTTLSPAELTNRATEEADHNSRPLPELLARFRSLRARLIVELEATPEEGWARSALHPRLKTPMRLLDLGFFVAEHDDHHLATITALLRSAQAG